jgi:hypothetical protein
MSGQLTQSPAMNRAETATMVEPDLSLFPDSNHGSHFQFTEPFNRYVTDFVDR